VIKWKTFRREKAASRLIVKEAAFAAMSSGHSDKVLRLRLGESGVEKESFPLAFAQDDGFFGPGRFLGGSARMERHGTERIAFAAMSSVNNDKVFRLRSLLRRAVTASPRKICRSTAPRFAQDDGCF